MHSSQTSIVICGRDSLLLDTRKWVLERAGTRVFTATDLSDFGRIPSDVSIDLVILCHSLTKEQCSRALALAGTYWPQAQSLVLISGQSGCYTGATKQVADAAQGPANLLHTVTELLGAARVNDIHAPSTQRNRESSNGAI
jgi:hypothetical protein